MMVIQTMQEPDSAIARLSQRTSQSLATFIVSLVHDDGPIGEHVRTFIVGDDLVETVASLKGRIDALRDREHRYYRHRDGAQVGERWNYILDAIETLVLPASAEQAFELLVLLVERHGDAVEKCADHDYTVQCALERATELMTRAGQSLPRSDVRAALERLIVADRYGAREPLELVAEAFAR
jgi:hypothetical protein